MYGTSQKIKDNVETQYFASQKIKETRSIASLQGRKIGRIFTSNRFVNDQIYPNGGAAAAACLCFEFLFTGQAKQASRVDIDSCDIGERCFIRFCICQSLE